MGLLRESVCEQRDAVESEEGFSRQKDRGEGGADESISIQQRGALRLWAQGGRHAQWPDREEQLRLCPNRLNHREPLRNLGLEQAHADLGVSSLSVTCRF